MKTARLLGTLAFTFVLLIVMPMGACAVCVPDPGSVIANGAFSGESCWTPLHDPQQLVQSFFMNGNFYAVIEGNNIPDAVYLKQIVALEAGMEYLISFTAWGNPGGSVVTFALQRDGDPFEQYGLWLNVPLQATTARYAQRFMCTTSDPEARFVVFLGNVTGVVCIDEIRIEPISCTQNNELVNPTFDCNGEHPIGWQWLSNNEATTFGLTTPAYHGTHAALLTNLPGGEFYDAFVDQQFLSWTANRYYLIRFWSRGTDTNSPMILKMQNDATGTIPVWVDYPVSTNWAENAFVFRPTETTTNGHLTLYAGQLDGNLEIDAFQFVEVPMPDFNPLGRMFYADVTGDAKADCIYFEMRDRWLVWVAESLGDRYAPFEEWCGPFAPLTAIPVLGNWNGVDEDSLVRQDIAMIDAASGLAIVRLSDGSAFVDPGTNPWYTGAIPAFDVIHGGDANGDGNDDLVLFALTVRDVFTMRSNGEAFIAPAMWHNNFPRTTTSKPFVGDLNNDSFVDLIGFTRANEGYVDVSLSNGHDFGSRGEWASLFVIHNEEPDVGDLNNDGKCDIVCYVHSDSDRRVYARLSTGSGFLPRQKWHDYLAGSQDDPSIADLTGDGFADAVMMNAQTHAILSARSWGGNFGDGLWWWTTDVIPPIEPPEEPLTGVEEPEGTITRALLSARAFPMPFRTSATLSYILPQRTHVRVAVYDIAGREVARLVDAEQGAGVHEMAWQPADRAPGVYFARLSAGGEHAVKKLILVR